MSRSFIAGSVAGLALSVAGLATASLVVPMSARQTEAEAEAALGAPADSGTETSTGAPETATAPEAVAEPATEAAAGSAPAATPEMPPETPAETAPVTAPEVSEETEAAGAPETAMLDAPQGSEFTRPKEDGSAALPEADAAPAEGDGTATTPPAASSAESAPAVVDTAPAGQPDTTAVTPPAAVAGAAPVTEAPPVSPAASGDSAPVTDLPALLQVEPAKEPARVSGAGQQGGAPMFDPLPEIASITEPAPVAPEGGSEPPPEQAGAAAIPLPSPDDSPASEDTASAEKPRVLTLDPAAPPAEEGQSLPGGTVPGVTILRLPGTDAPVAGNEPAGEAAAVDPAAEKAAAAPLRAFAARWQNVEQRPVLAVLILDKGVEAGGLDPSALAALPFAVTIAVDPMRAGAAAAATAYRAAGDEVAILIGSAPVGATPADFEVAYQTFVQTLPESVAVIGDPDAAFLRSSLGAQHMAALLAADGRGLVTYDQGLNPGRRAAEKAGVPVASVDKTFGAGEVNMGTLARELDRAAFAAGQTGQMVIALPSTPDAITAFVAWATGPSGSTVSVAPVSALMLQP